MGGEHERGFRESHASVTSRSSADTLLAQNSKLSSKLEGLLPPGTDLQAAASGFKNLGQFVAAVHVSHNLGLSFTQLKADMVKAGLSLGQSIHRLRPNVDSDNEAEKGEREAEVELRVTTS